MNQRLGLHAPSRTRGNAVPFDPDRTRTRPAARRFGAEALERRTLMAGVAADLDPAFSNDGRAVVDYFDLDDTANDVAVLAGGEVIVAGSAATERSVRSAFALAKFNANGTLDKSFGPGGFDGDGQVTTNFPLGDPNDSAVNIAGANRVLVLPNGKILAAGVAPAPPVDDPAPPDPFAGGRDFALVQYHSDGSLDLGFGGGDGIVLTSFTGIGGQDEAFGLSVGPGGKIVLAGVARLGRGSSAAVVRYNPDGSIDETFSPGGSDGDGRLLLNLGNLDFTSAADAVVLADGRILLACLAGENSRSDFALVRLSPAGAVERQRTLAFLGSEFNADVVEAAPRRLALIPNGGGDFYAAGAATLTNRTDTDFAVARFNPDFTLDTAFGGDGRVTVDFGGRHDVANDLAVLPNGKVLLAGHSLLFNNSGGLPDGVFSLARLNANGSLDTTFDEGSGGLRGDGRRTTRFNGTATGNGLAVAPDGKYVVAGEVRFQEPEEDFSESDMAVARYLGETAGPAPSPDSDDQIAEAPRFSVGQNVSRTINGPGDVDMVRFSVTAGQRVLLDVDRASGSTLDSFLRLFNAQGTQLASNDNGGADAARGNAALTFTFSTGGTYFAAVSAKRNTRYDPITGRGDADGGSRGAYVLKLRNAPAPGVASPAPTWTRNALRSADEDER